MAIHDRYTDEEVEYIKKYYPTASWDEMLSNLHRDKESIIHKAYSLGIKRKNGPFASYSAEEDKLILDLYSNIGYGDLDAEINKLITGYMPHRTPSSIKYRANRIGAFVRKPWTETEDQFLIDNYYIMTVNELADCFENHGRESVYNRIRKLGLTGAPTFAYTEYEKNFIYDNYQTMSDDEIGEAIGRSGKSIKTYRNKHGMNKPVPDGVVYYLPSFIDRNNSEWKRASAKNCDYKCVITGERFDNIHHLYARSLIIQDVRRLHSEIPTGINVNELDDESRMSILKWFHEEQAKHPLGICLKHEIHREFHDRYGYGYNTPEQFYEFVQDIAPDKLEYVRSIA